MENERAVIFRPKDVTIVGAVMVVAQAISGAQTSVTVQHKLEDLALQFQESQLEREKYFVRKSDVALLAEKIDQLKNQISSLNQKMSGYKESRLEDLSDEETCSNHDQLFLASHD